MIVEIQVRLFKIACRKREESKLNDDARAHDRSHYHGCASQHGWEKPAFTRRALTENNKSPSGNRELRSSCE